MKTRFHIILLLFSVMALGLPAAFPQAPAKPQVPPIDGLGRLQIALQAAGAPSLAAAQQSGIRTLILEFRKARRNAVLNTALQGARKVYENAILNKDLSTAASQAQIIANAQAEGAVQRETDIAAFAIEVIKILETEPPQVDALINQIGKNGFVRLILSLAGVPGGPRPAGPAPF